MSIKSGVSNGVCQIEIARPEKKNALTAQMYADMAEALIDAQNDKSVRAVLITGQPGIFTSGNDLEDFMQRPPQGMDSPVFAFMRALAGCNKPVVVAVTGAAIGIGTTMLLHSDLVYAADTAKFAMPFTSLGLVSEFASSMLVPLTAGHVKAAEKLLLGEPFGAEEALEMRIINTIVPEAEVLAHARRMAERFNQLPPGAVADTKRLMRRAHEKLVMEMVAAEGDIFSQRLKSPEAREAFTAFFEKRKPDFSKF
jgi:enoyl-CoA hydratase/carnithine racemase